MTPTHKKLLSAFAVVVGGATLTLINQYAVKLPAEAQGFVGSVIAGAMLLLRAWGTAEEQEAKVEVKAQAKAAEIVATVLDGEAP